jgi:hypothetical protein
VISSIVKLISIFGNDFAICTPIQWTRVHLKTKSVLLFPTHVPGVSLSSGHRFHITHTPGTQIQCASGFWNRLSGVTPSVFLIHVQLASSVLIFFLSQSLSVSVSLSHTHTFSLPLSLSLSLVFSLFLSLCISVYVYTRTHTHKLHTYFDKRCWCGRIGLEGVGGLGVGWLDWDRRVWEDWDSSGKSRQAISAWCIAYKYCLGNTETCTTTLGVLCRTEKTSTV